MGAPSTSSPSSSITAPSSTHDGALLTSSELTRVDDAIDAARWIDVSGTSGTPRSRSHQEEDDS
jgi:hypothetical protein